MFGVLVNALAVIAGSGLGLLLRRGLPQKYTDGLMQALGLCVIVIGILGLNAKVDSIIKQGCSANFVRFTPNTVMPKGRESNMAEHMYAFDRAYLLDSAREWLFRQTK